MMKSAIIVLFAAGTAHAEQVEKPSIQKSATYSFDMGSHVRWLGDTSAAILTDDALAGMRMTLGRSLGSLDVAGRDVAIGVFTRWVLAFAQGTFFNDALDTSIEQNTLGAGLRFDAPLRWRLRMVGQAEVGMAHTALEITQGDVMPVDDEHWAPYATASLGADLLLVKHPRFHLGLGVDLGYTVTIPVGLHALPGDRPDEQLSIDTTFSEIGKLDLRGVTYSMSLRGSF
jgi:hypothetical protein